MPFLIKALIILPIFLFTTAKNFLKLWKVGIIGVLIMVAADYIGYRYNLYKYKECLVMLGGFLLLFNIFNLFLVSMMFANWLPKTWPKRILYTIYMSVIFLAIEAVMYTNNAIYYPNWKLWYSYFLNIGGLSLMIFLWDLVRKETAAVSTQYH